MAELTDQDRKIMEAYEPLGREIDQELERKLDALGKPSPTDIFNNSRNIQHQFIHWLDMHRGLLSPEGVRQLDEMAGDRRLLHPMHAVLERHLKRNKGQ